MEGISSVEGLVMGFPLGDMDCPSDFVSLVVAAGALPYKMWSQDFLSHLGVLITTSGALYNFGLIFLPCLRRIQGY